MPASPLITVNAGSSSLRLSAFSGERRILAERSEPPASGRVETLERFLSGRSDFWPAAVVHRVVHGGGRGEGAHRVDGALEAEMARLSELAPLHNPPALAWIHRCKKLFGPSVPQLAVFDTAFFAGLPEAAAAYALPRELSRELSLRRYGFHGVAHRSMWERWRELRPDLPDGGRVISFQLGGGCSAAAIDGGRPVDTSMGFSPLEGLVMATRSGDVDPGLVLYLVRKEGGDVAKIEAMLNGQSGLAGLSGTSADPRVLFAKEAGEGEEARAAALAIEVFCRRAKKYLGAYLALLGGADGVLFGGGIGEHQPEVRAQILRGLEWAGLRLSPENGAAVGREARITAPESRIAAWVLPVDEERLLAREGAAWLRSAAAG